MTLVTEALDRVARQCSIDVPQSWLAATAAEYVEVRDDFLAETIADILDRLDLPSPIGKQQTITGDGSENYALNSDFRRMQRDQLAVYDSNLDRPCIPVTNDGEYTYIKDIGTSGVLRYYRVKGFPGSYTIDFYDEPSAGLEVVVSYVSENWIDNAGTKKTAFTDPDDTLLLPRRIVEVGTVWRWRERKGLPFQDKYNEYEALMGRLSNDTRGHRVVDMGERQTDVRWQDLIPAYIPSS